VLAETINMPDFARHLRERVFRLFLVNHA